MHKYPPTIDSYVMVESRHLHMPSAEEPWPILSKPPTESVPTPATRTIRLADTEHKPPRHERRPAQAVPTPPISSPTVPTSILMSPKAVKAHDLSSGAGASGSSSGRRPRSPHIQQAPTEPHLPIAASFINRAHDPLAESWREQRHGSGYNSPYYYQSPARVASPPAGFASTSTPSRKPVPSMTERSDTYNYYKPRRHATVPSRSVVGREEHAKAYSGHGRSNSVQDTTRLPLKHSKFREMITSTIASASQH
jgi:hypothetical protein